MNVFTVKKGAHSIVTKNMGKVKVFTIEVLSILRKLKSIVKNKSTSACEKLQIQWKPGIL